MAQAVSLNALYTQLAYRARNAEYVDSFDRYLRLALKAQGQCRATLETLATMKNPPTVIARQANITSGPQQVNSSFGAERPILAGARLQLEAGHEPLDLRAATATTRGDTNLAPVVPLDGAAHPAGKARSARNAWRGGMRQRERELMGAISRGLAVQREAMRRVASS